MEADLFGEVPQPQQSTPREAPKPLTAEDVRLEMLRLINRLRSSEEMPFAPDELKRNVAIFPIMAKWLPSEDGEQLCFEFRQELERLGFARAA